MLRAHTMAASYGKLPHEVLGIASATWEALIVDTAAFHVGDGHAQATIKRAGGAMPVVVVGHG